MRITGNQYDALVSTIGILEKYDAEECDCAWQGAVYSFECLKLLRDIDGDPSSDAYDDLCDVVIFLNDSEPSDWDWSFEIRNLSELRDTIYELYYPFE